MFFFFPGVYYIYICIYVCVCTTMALCAIWSFVPRCLMWSAPGSPQPPPTSPQWLVPMFRKSLGSRWLVGMIVTMDQWSHQRDRKDMRKWFVWPQKDRNVISYLNCDKLLFDLFGSSYQCITVLVCSSNYSGSLLFYLFGVCYYGQVAVICPWLPSFNAGAW